MRKRTEIGLEKVVSTLKNISRYVKKEEDGEWAQVFKLDFGKMVLAKEEALSKLVSAKQVLTELKAEVEKTNLADHASVD